MYFDRVSELERFEKRVTQKGRREKREREREALDIIGRLTNQELSEMLMSYYVTFVYRGQRKGSKRRKEREEEEEEEEKSARRLKMAWHTVHHRVSRTQVTQNL